jgi:choloylglycine hydrolase
MKGAQLRKPITRALALGLAGFMLCLPVAQACTRLTYLGDNQTVITARSMDWKTDVATNLWIFPQGMQRNGEVGAGSIKWTSRYGSVIASGYDIATTDGGQRGRFGRQPAVAGGVGIPNGQKH